MFAYFFITILPTFLTNARRAPPEEEKTLPPEGEMDRDMQMEVAVKKAKATTAPPPGGDVAPGPAASVAKRIAAQARDGTLLYDALTSELS
jgi:hypothetical protein